MGQLRIAVQGNHKTDVRQVVRFSHIHQLWSVLRSGAVNQAVQLLQFAPLAFPADEFLFGLTPDAFAVEQQETVAAMALVQFCQACNGLLQKFGVVFPRARGGVGVIREQAEEQIGFLVGQVADLQLFNLVLDRFRVGQHHRYDYQGPEGVGNSGFLKIHFGQGAGRQKTGDQIINGLNRQLADRNQQEQQQSDADRRRRPGVAQGGHQIHEQYGQAADTAGIDSGMVTIDPFQDAIADRFMA